LGTKNGSLDLVGTNIRFLPSRTFISRTFP